MTPASKSLSQVSSLFLSCPGNCSMLRYMAGPCSALKNLDRWRCPSKSLWLLSGLLTPGIFITSSLTSFQQKVIQCRKLLSYYIFDELLRFLGQSEKTSCLILSLIGFSWLTKGFVWLWYHISYLCIDRHLIFNKLVKNILRNSNCNNFTNFENGIFYHWAMCGFSLLLSSFVVVVVGFFKCLI